MPDEATTTETTTATETTTEKAPEASADDFKPITSQADLHRILDDRLQRERAKYADYRQLKEAAKRLQQIEDEGKSETQKLTDRIQGLEGELGNARREALVFRISAAHGITDEDAELFLTGNDEETLTRQAERLVGRREDAERRPPYVAREGNSSAAHPKAEERETARRLFSGP